MKVNCAHQRMVPTAQMIEHDKNANKHSDRQIQMLAKILKYQGWRHPIVVSALSGKIVAGHCRYRAAILNGWTEVPVDLQQFDDVHQELAFLLSDNLIAELAETDEIMLEEINLELGEDFDWELLGLEEKLLITDEIKEAIEDDVPEITKSISKLGDLYELGDHRLLCGDSTDKATVERLMNGAKADMVFTDPPYGISYKSKNVGGWGKDTSGREIKNDESTEVAKKVWEIIADLKCAAVIWGGNYFTDFLPVNGKWFVWNKLAFDKPNQNFSHCELAWSNLPGDQVEMMSHVWDGAFRAGAKKEEGTSRIHPNQKPIGLTEKILDGANVLDLFGGSGSTLIACEKTNRKCFMMELDPHYVDIIVSRWCKYTGKTEIKRNGEPMTWTLQN